MYLQDVKHLSDHPQVKTARLKTDWLYTSRRYPLYWHHIAKNGGSFFKNLLYFLDNDRLREPTSQTHNWDNELIRATNASEEEIRKSHYGLIIMRNPIHRFVSVYFDKVYDGSGDRRPGMAREFFANHQINQAADLSPEGHAENCLKLAEWSARNISGQTKSQPNWHLVPQLHQVSQVYRVNFRAVTLSDFEWQMSYALEGLIPDIRNKMAAVGKVNVSKKPFPKSAVVTPELRSRLKDIYSDDFKVFHEVRQFWREKKEQSV